MTGGAFLLILCSIVFLSYALKPTLMEKDKKMKVRLLIMDGILLTSIIGTLLFFSVYRNKKERSAPPSVNDTATIQPISPIVISSEKALELPVNAEDTQMETPATSDTDTLLARWNQDRPLLASDKQKIDEMMAKFEDLESMSESDIISTLIGFVSEEIEFQQSTHYPQFVETFYKRLDGVASYDTHEKVLITVNFLYKALRSYKEMQVRAAEETRIALALKAADPDLFFEIEIQKERDQIAATEQQIREAEAKGDSEWAEINRNYLATLHREIKWLEFEKNFDENINAIVAERLEERLPQVEAEFQESLRQIIAEFESASNPVSQKDTGASPVVSEHSDEVAGDPVTFDPVRSMSSAQSNLNSWRSDFDESYLDVIASRNMSPEELDKFFPTEQERENLKSRTSEMQRAVVSKIRKVVSEIPNATQAQKSKLARELVNANFDKDFAEAVLSELEKDTE